MQTIYIMHMRTVYCALRSVIVTTKYRYVATGNMLWRFLIVSAHWNALDVKSCPLKNNDPDKENLQ